MSDLDTIVSSAEAALAAAQDLAGLDAIRVQVLGKKGELTQLLKGLGKLPAEERPAAGQAINEAKQALTSTLDARRDVLNQEQLERKLAADAVDVTRMKPVEVQAMLPASSSPGTKVIAILPLDEITSKKLNPNMSLRYVGFCLLVFLDRYTCWMMSEEHTKLTMADGKPMY